jgi:hypothetical protein
MAAHWDFRADRLGAVPAVHGAPTDIASRD